MGAMFSGCYAVKALDVTGFNTSNVTNMENMFLSCKALETVDVTGFDTSKIKNYYEVYGGYTQMFCGCTNLREVDISKFDTSNNPSMSGMFKDCEKLTKFSSLPAKAFTPLKMDSMFEGCKSLVVYSNAVGKNNFNADWFDTSKCETMARLFFGCSKIEALNLEGWTVSNVTDMNNMFAGCSNLTGIWTSTTISWDTSKVTNMHGMFGQCAKLDEIADQVACFNTSNVADMSEMFFTCSALTELDVSTWNVSKVSDMTEMFQNCGNITTIYAKDPSDWKSESKTIDSTSTNMFDACVKLKGHESYQEGTTT